MSTVLWFLLASAAIALTLWIFDYCRLPWTP
jgi:hypothetical protein